MKKILTLAEVPILIQQLRDDAKTVVLAGGCFDLLHEGHLEFLKAAKKEGDVFIVALESDQNIKRLKGPDRPIHKIDFRIKNLLDTGLVDYIIVLPDSPTANDYAQLVKSTSPGIIAVTSDDLKMIIKQNHAQKFGSVVKIVIDRLPGFSTTEIIQKKK